MTLSNLVRMFAALAASLCLMFPGAQAQDGQTLNYRDADVRAVIDDVSLVTGYTFIVDPAVNGMVTITSQTPLSRDELFTVFLSTLRVNGYTAVRTRPGTYQILPDQEAARAGGPVGGTTDGDQFVTAVLRLQHASARGAVAALRPITSTQGVVNSVDGSNIIVMVDYAANIERARGIIAGLDRDTSIYEIVTLANVSATDMAQIIDGMGARTGSDEDGLFGVTVVPVPSSNSILIRGDRDAVTRMRELAQQVDAVSVSTQDYRVVTLSHADGASLLPILEGISAQLSGGEGVPAATVSVAFHAPTNSLILNAPPDAQRQLEAVIRQLDVRRPQVLVEAIIVEISDTAARDLGVQFLLTGDTDGDAPFLMTRYRNSSPDLLAIGGALTVGENDDGTAANPSLRDLALASLLNAGGITAGFAGEDGNGNIFGLILNALREDVNSNILSTPSILTLDNQEASILVGQQIPITTGEVLGSSNTNPFRTIERQDVGVQLEVRPLINDGDTIQLFIRQEVSSVFGTVSSRSDELITNQREIQTTVLADNGEIIVLGGLIQRDEQESVSAVPGLGSIPGLGRLFRSEGRSATRTNLMVFIRPTIIRSAADMRGTTGRSYGRVRAGAGAMPPEIAELEAIADMLALPPRAAEPAAGQ